MKKKGIRYLAKHQFTGTLPGPTEAERKQAQAEWEFRIEAAKFMLGLSETQIEKMAKEDYESEPGGKGRTGDEKWDKDCEPSRKLAYVDDFLPKMKLMTERYGHKHIVISEPDKNEIEVKW